MSSIVVRYAVSLLVAHSLQNTTGVDGSATIVTKTSGELTVDVAEGGSVIAALAMVAGSGSATAELTEFEGSGYGDTMLEGTPPLFLIATGCRSAGSQVVNITASDDTYNFRAFAVSVH